jgi:hypothetical protein
MIRLISVAFVLAVATSAQAMSPAPLHQPDGMTMQVQGRVARQVPPWCDYTPGQVRVYGCPRCGVNGICMLRTPPLTRQRGNRRSYPDSGLTPLARPGANVI